MSLIAQNNNSVEYNFPIWAPHWQNYTNHLACEYTVTEGHIGIIDSPMIMNINWIQLFCLILWRSQQSIVLFNIWDRNQLFNLLPHMVLVNNPTNPESLIIPYMFAQINWNYWKNNEAIYFKDKSLNSLNKKLNQNRNKSLCNIKSNVSISVSIRTGHQLLSSWMAVRTYNIHSSRTFCGMLRTDLCTCRSVSHRSEACVKLWEPAIE